MATKSELWDQLLQEIKILDEIYKFGAENTPNFLAMESALQGFYQGAHVGATQQQITNLRNSLSALLANGSAALRAVILELAKIGYSSIATAVDAALLDIYSGMVDDTETVRYRNFTRGAVSAGGGNNGDGTVYRLTKDENNHDLEGSFQKAGDVKIEITRDFATGASQGSEQGLLFGDGETKTDELQIGDAPPGSITIVALNSSSQGNLVVNGGFETATGSAGDTDTEFTGWELSSQSDIDVEETTLFRGLKALNFLDNADILQYILTETIDPTIPVFALVRFYRELSCDGTLTLRLGSQTEAVALSAQSGWTDLILGAGSSTKGWYENFKEDSSGAGIRIQLTLSGRTTGNLLIDEFVIFQPVFFDGLYYLLTAGSDAGDDFLKGDYFTFSDSVVNTGRTQLWIARLFGRYFPHATSGETYADK